MGEVSNEKGQKKGKKKDKSQKMDLNAFNNMVVGTPEEPKMDWAAELENDLQHRGMHRGSIGGATKQSLPTAPRRLMDQQIDFSFLPDFGPYQLMLDNAPFDVTIEQICTFFAPVVLKDINLGQDKSDSSYSGNARKGPPVVEFNSRDELIKAYTDKQDENLGRRAVHLRSPHEQRNNQGPDRRNDFGKRDNERYGNQGPGRSEAELGGNWRDNLPAAQPPQQPFVRQDNTFVRQENNRQDSRFIRDDVRIERAPIRPQEPENFNIMRRSSRDEPVQPLPGLQPFDRQVGPRFSGNFNRSDSQDDRASHDSFGSRGGPGQFSRQSSRGYSTPYGDEPPAGFDSRPRRQDDRFGDRRSYNDGRPPQGRDSRNSYEPSKDVQIVRNPVRQPVSPALLSRQESYDSNPPIAVAPERTERPKLNLMQRTVPIEEIAKPAAASSAIFGGAKPVDTEARLREVEEKKRQEKERLEEEAKKAQAQKAEAEKQAQEKAAAEKSTASPIKPTVSAQSSSSESAPFESGAGARSGNLPTRTGYQGDIRRNPGPDALPHNRSGSGNYPSGGSTSYYNSNNNRNNNNRTGGAGSSHHQSNENWQRNARPSPPTASSTAAPAHVPPQPAAVTAAPDDADKQFVRRAEILRRVSSNASETSERESNPDEAHQGVEENAESTLTGTKVEEEDVAGGGASDTSSQGGFTVVKKKERERPPMQNQKSRTFIATSRGGGPSSRGTGRGASNSARSGNTGPTQPGSNEMRRGSGGTGTSNGYANTPADGAAAPRPNGPNQPPVWRIPASQTTAKTS